MASAQLLVEIRKLSKSLSVRAAAFGLIAFITSLFAVGFSDFVPKQMSNILGGSASEQVLDILAKSMLVVVTFSMSTLIATYSMITSTTTPRATKLIMENSSAHNALSTFLGAFIFSVVSLVSLSTGLYGPQGRVFLFAITLVVLLVVIATIVRWIGRLSNLGHLEFIVEEIGRRVEKSLTSRSVVFGWNAGNTINPMVSYFPVIFRKKTYGHIQSLDMEKLAELAESKNVDIYLDVAIGEAVGPGKRIALFSFDVSKDKDFHNEIESCLAIGDVRTFDEDPCYGLNAISELASKALSPGVNDPGSAIHVIHSLTGLIFNLSKTDRQDFGRVFPKPIEASQIFDIAFTAIARDGANNVEVAIVLQRALVFLSKFKMFEEQSFSLSRSALERAKSALNYKEDYQRLVAASLHSNATRPEPGT